MTAKEKAIRAAYEYYNNAADAINDEHLFNHAARVALEKQIRQKPVRVNECPACRKHMMIHHNFCPDCGQALDWQQEG